jgi:single-strand DNA-binding protein
MQNVTVVGRLGADPQMRFLNDGTPVCNFSIATDKVWTGADGDQKQKTTWFRVSAFGKQAENHNQYLSKGREVAVTGEVDASAWVDKDGNPRATLELRARNVQYLGSANGNGHQADVEDFAPLPESEPASDLPF